MDEHSSALWAKFAIFCGVVGLVVRHLGFGEQSSSPFWLAIGFIVWGAYALPLPKRDGEE